MLMPGLTAFLPLYIPLSMFYVLPHVFFNTKINLRDMDMVKKKSLAGSGKTVAKLKEKKTVREVSASEPVNQPAQEPMLQAMVWYKEEHYEQLLTIFDDAELLPPTYQAWLARAEEKKTEVEAAGDQVMKVFIDPETFPEWCAQKGLPKDAEARTQLALEVAQARSFSL